MHVGFILLRDDHGDGRDIDDILCPEPDRRGSERLQLALCASVPDLVRNRQ